MTRLSIENLEKREMMSADTVAEAPVIPEPELQTAVLFDVETDGTQPLINSPGCDDFAHLVMCPIETESVWDDTDMVHIMRTDAMCKTSLDARHIELDSAVDRAYTNPVVFSQSARRMSIDMHGQRGWTGSDNANATSTYVDVNGDGVVSPMDALLVINQISEDPVNAHGVLDVLTDGNPRRLDVLGCDVVNPRVPDREGMQKTLLLLPAVQALANYPGDDELNTNLLIDRSGSATAEITDVRNSIQTAITDVACPSEGSGRVNEYILDDTSGHERIDEHGPLNEGWSLENDLREHVLDDRSRDVANNETISIGSDRAEMVGCDESLWGRIWTSQEELRF